MVNKKLLLEHILKSDLTATEKRYLEKLIDSVKWISVKDRLPDTDTMVIVAIYGSDMITIQESETLLDALNRSKKEFNRITMAFINEGYWCDTDGYPLMVTPSYWMPLPEPPEQKGETS